MTQRDQTHCMRVGVMSTLIAPPTSKDIYCVPEGYVIQDVLITGVSSSDVTIHGVRSREVTEFPIPTAVNKLAGHIGIAIYFPSPMYPSATTPHYVGNVASNKYVGIVLSNNNAWSNNGCHYSITYVPQ